MVEIRDKSICDASTSPCHQMGFPHRKYFFLPQITLSLLPSRLQSSGRGSLPGIFVRKVLHNYSKLSFPGVILNGETDAENLRIFPPLLKYRITEQAEMPVNPGFPLLPRYRNRRSRNE